MRNPGLFILAATISFVCMNVAGALIAMAMAPFVRPAFRDLIRDPATDGLLLPALLTGYFVVSLAVAYLWPRLESRTWRSTIGLGVSLGCAVFFGGHLIIAGWSRMPAVAMAVSGALDSIAIIIGTAVTAGVYRFAGRKTT
jgi:hypothetical protein